MQSVVVDRGATAAERRSGRFDELFFVDLPRAEVRRRIFEIHLDLRGQDSGAIDLDSVTEAAKGFSGAEIEQAIVSACFRAHAQEGPPDRSHVLAEIVQTRPLSVVRRESVEALREWAQDRTVSVD